MRNAILCAALWLAACPGSGSQPLDAGLHCGPDASPSCAVCGPLAPVGSLCQIGGPYPECLSTSCYSTCPYMPGTLPPECQQQCARCADGCMHCDTYTKKWVRLALDYCYNFCPKDAGP